MLKYVFHLFHDETAQINIYPQRRCSIKEGSLIEDIYDIEFAGSIIVIKDTWDLT